MLCMKITVTILTKNSSRYLAEVLNSVRSFDEVLILDTGSTDDTLSIAQNYPNVKVHHSEFTGFGPLHNQMVDLARNEWILSLDSDEVLSSTLIDEIHQCTLDTTTVYAISRHNTYNGRFIKGCGWYPDYVKRLFHRQHTRFNDALVHESVQLKGLKEQRLKGHIKHYSYSCTQDFLQKMQRYSDLYASEHKGKKTSSLTKAVGHAAFSFFKSYFLQRGMFCGKEGFIISVYNANTAFYKYLKLAESSKDHQQTR